MSVNGNTLVAGLRFGFLLGWRERFAAAGPSVFWLTAALSIVVDIALNYALVNHPAEFFPGGFNASAFWIVQALLLASLLSYAAGRPAWLWSIATWLLTAGLLMRALLCPIFAQQPDTDRDWLVFHHQGFALSLGVWMMFSSMRLWRWLEPRWHLLKRTLAFAIMTAVGFALPHYLLDYGPGYFYTLDPDADDAQQAGAAPRIPTEDLFAEQDQRVNDLLNALAPQRPGHVDVYFIGVAGDADEDVFANEVQYAQELFDGRFDTKGRSLLLINHPDTIEDVPLATERNLRHVLAGVAERIDLDEDIVFLFLTSHGSAEHELSIVLDDLPLQQITPDSLASAISDAGIRWRVDVISACYSGGYVDALSSATALVMTAASADRTSFGCGADADVTFFGRAYFVEALNQTADFVAAFGLADEAIRQREREAGETPSQPQIASGAMIEAKLAQWRAQFTPGKPVPFEIEVSEIDPASADAQ